MSVNQLPYLPIVNPENNPCVQTVIHADRHQNVTILFTGLLPTFPEN